MNMQTIKNEVYMIYFLHFCMISILIFYFIFMVVREIPSTSSILASYRLRAVWMHSEILTPQANTQEPVDAHHPYDT